MNILTKSNGGYDQHSVEAWLRSVRTIWLEGDISDEMAAEFSLQIAYYTIADREKPVKVFINSNGGSVDAGMRIYDIIRSCGLRVEMYCLGHAYSMAAFIFAAGRHGRYLLEHAKIMIHEPMVITEGVGKSGTIADMAKSLLELKEKTEAMLADFTGKKKEEIAAATAKDSCFEGEEAVSFGLADGVIGYDRMLEGLEL